MAYYNDQIGANGSPYLCFYSIDALPIERFDSQVLFDPFKEQFDLPATLVIVGDLAGITMGYVGQQHNILIILLVNQTNTSQRLRVMMLGLIPCQADYLITLQAAGGVHRCGGFSIEPQILLGSDDKAAALPVQVIQPLEIQVSPIHDVDTACPNRDHIQNVHIMGLAIGNMDKSGDRALQIHHRVKFDGGLLLSKLGPWKQRKAQINGRRIQDFNRFGHLIFAIQMLSLVDQYHGQILIDLPRSMRIGIGEGTEGNVGFNTHVVTPGSESTQGGGQIPQTISKGELSKAHTKQLVPAREFLCVIITFVMINNFSEFVFRNNIHKL